MSVESILGPILVGGPTRFSSYNRTHCTRGLGPPRFSNVGKLWALDLIRIVFLCRIAYQVFVVGFGDPASVASLFALPTLLILYLGFSGAQTLYCQGLLLYSVLGLASITAFVLNTVSMKNPMLLDPGPGEFLVSLAIRAAVDTVTSMLLLRELKPRTNLALTRYITVIAASGLATSVTALACVAAFAANSESFTFAWLALHFALRGFCSNAVVTNFHLDINSRAFQRSPSGAAELLSLFGAAAATEEADNQVPLVFRLLLHIALIVADCKMVEFEHISAYQVNYAGIVTDGVIQTNPPGDTRAEVVPGSSRRSVLSDDYPPTYKSMGEPL
ncbi:hypothetical protein GGX14DRAFT_636814 [Mycena pura]|uniref:Uncharacterized protein n=1 Tax=Mycena pura TaxID=153505 RepID=A0AAD6YBF1_9AGAR|nr:hypothetical protein GGX14DRAFT_636814 [Mycena pura]